MSKTQKFHGMFIILLFLLANSCGHPPPDIAPNRVTPSEEQIRYQRMEIIGFIHFTINTFTDKEWGYGDESPDLFNPEEFNPRQWAKLAKEAGLKQLILTAKHHDGFCLWPSNHTDHSVKNSRWKEGKGDAVREFVDACHENGLKAGLYLSPWDRNHAEYGRPGYLTFYKNQLKELLTGYGPISEIWFDGANGGTGFYGGARENRTIDRTSYYQWDDTFKWVKDLQPGILIFSDAGPDIRWIGNEKGFAGETNWSTINSKNLTIGASDPKYLNTGDPLGENWIVGECDVSIRPGWFYHKREDPSVKSPRELVDIYYRSVGRNGVLLLNLPPDRRGLIHETDTNNLREFGEILRETFKTNLARSMQIKASNYRLSHKKFSPDNILDGNNKTYWAADDQVREASLEIGSEEDLHFDRIMICEPIRFGQRISEFSIEANLKNQWTQIAQGTTIGYKRLLRIKPVKTKKIRLVIKKSNNVPAISDFGLFKASPKESAPSGNTKLHH